MSLVETKYVPVVLLYLIHVDRPHILRRIVIPLLNFISCLGVCWEGSNLLTVLHSVIERHAGLLLPAQELSTWKRLETKHAKIKGQPLIA